jgi:hypothetical protein
MLMFGRLLATAPLDADWVTFGHDFAIPIRPEAGRLTEQRKPYDNESAEAHRNESNQDAQNVSARWVPVRPSHLLNLYRWLHLSKCVF